MTEVNCLRRIFHPTKEEQISDLEMLLKFHQELIGSCSTCANHIPSNMPGFVTDYGECKAEAEMFPAKVCGLTDDPCPMYVEDTEFVKDINLKIQQLRQPGKAGQGKPPGGD